MINLKNNKGAITLYILVCVLFFAIAIVSVHTNLKHKEARKESEYQKIKASYAKDAEEEYEKLGIISLVSIIKKGEPVKEKTTALDKNRNPIVIPKGFKVLDEARLIADGVVVEAPDKSEFVWVPVNNINSMVMCQGSTGDNDCNIEESEDKLVCTTHSGNDICGKLYAEEIENKFNEDLTTQTYNANSGLREPAIIDESSFAASYGINGIEFLKSVTGISGTNDAEVLDNWQKQLQREYEAMAISVYHNKGFYVGRYETSVDENSKAQSKANKESGIRNLYNSDNQRWYGLYQREKEYSEKEYNAERDTLEDIVGSTMIWGSQYDQMMLWMQDNGYNVKSTNSTDLKGAIPNTNYTTTGVEEDKDKLNNIYDLLGGSIEWTLEAYKDKYYEEEIRVWRGAFGDSVAPSDRSAGFRIGFF